VDTRVLGRTTGRGRVRQVSTVLGLRGDKGKARHDQPAPRLLRRQDYRDAAMRA
jgi:hypothetical protein